MLTTIKRQKKEEEKGEAEAEGEEEGGSRKKAQSISVIEDNNRIQLFRP